MMYVTKCFLLYTDLFIGLIACKDVDTEFEMNSEFQNSIVYVKELGEKRQLTIQNEVPTQYGSALVARELSKSQGTGTYQTLTKGFSQVVFENDFKWRQWNESKSNDHPLYRMEWTFEALEWLKLNNISVRGHYLAWAPIDRNIYYQELKDTPEQFEEELFNHIEEKLLATKDYISEWDAINHIVAHHEDGTRLEHIYGKKIYLEILDFAHSIHPEAKLYVNESGILANRWNSKQIRDDYFNIIKYLLENDAPLHGIGFMSHFNHNSESSSEEITKILDRFAVFELPLKITEFDYQLGERQQRYSASDDELQRQSDFTEMFLKTVASHPSVEGIIMWGFWEGRHWYPGAALYDLDWNIRPNGEVWNRFVENYFWSEKQLSMDGSGRISFTALPGNYQLIISEENVQQDTITFILEKNKKEYYLKKNQDQWIISGNE